MRYNVKKLKQKLYRLYEHKFRLIDEDLSTELIDREIDNLEELIQKIQLK